jgi:hypothetical protein
MVTYSIRKVDGELEEDLPPVLHSASPPPENVHRGQIKHFEQCFVRRENAFTFGDLTKLTMVTLDHVGGLDEFADFGRILKERNELGPIVTP